MPGNSESQSEFKHSIGDTVQLQFFPGKEDERYYVKLIGFLEGKSILVTTPRADGVALNVSNEQELIVRIVSGKSAQGFTSSVIHATKHPYPHLHLTYPSNLDLKTTTIRKAERIDCELIVTVRDSAEPNSKTTSAALHDISTAGTQLFSNQKLGEVGDNILINAKFSVALMEQYLSLSGLIRRAINSPKEGGKYEYGIEFTTIEDKDKLVLTAFVYEQMMKLS